MFNERTTAMLSAPILPLLFKMATPQAAGFFIQASVSIAEIWFIGQLGTTGLAAMALVFPLLMLMQMLSGGAIGGAVTGATARSLGAGQLEKAQAYLWQVIYMAVGLACMFSLIYFLTGGEILSLLGGSDEVLADAKQYTDILFPCCFVIWLVNMMLGVVRGSGNMQLPAKLMIISALLQIPLSGILILGLGPIPALGIQGAAISILTVNSVSLVIVFVYLASESSVIKLETKFSALRLDLIKDTLSVGALASVSPFFTVGGILMVTGLVGQFGVEALAGYGIAARVEMLVAPLVFGIGVSMNALVGTCIGNGDIDRAEKIGWIGAISAGVITGLVGILLALFPEAWISIFSEEPKTVEIAAAYFRITAPFFACLGIGLALFFASQGARAIGWPVISTVVRFVIGVLGGWLLIVKFNGDVESLFMCIAVGLLVYGVINCAALYFGAWRRKVPQQELN